MPETITVETLIDAPIDTVWDYFTQPEHIEQWNHASPDWHTPEAENDLIEGGTFTYRMEAKDGSAGFDYTGTYDEIIPQAKISYTLDDGRAVTVTFTEEGDRTYVSETFEAEGVNPIDMQRDGWQAILDSFKAHVEG